MDKLEKYIRENRDRLDLYEADNSVWNNILLGQKRTVLTLRTIFSRAAMVILIAASSVCIYKLTSSQITSGSGRSYLNSELSSGFAETEIYYNTKVNSLMNEAKPLLLSDPGLEKDLMIDISRLDSLCTDIRRDLKDNVQNQEVIEALVMNYRAKVQILEDMLHLLRNQEFDNNNNQKQNEL